MFIFLDKREKKGYYSKSKVEISRVSGINYHTLKYYFSKGFYENERGLFYNDGEFLKSKQGGLRIKN